MKTVLGRRRVACIREDRNEIVHFVSFSLQTDLPIVEQEAEAGQSDGELQPPPVGNGVGHAREHQEPHRERHLVQDPHCFPVAQPDELCNCRGKARISSVGVSATGS